ncbi:MAG: RagB/SusD family nutrient uptake outer membrane protein [Chitinophagales bacterium]|nr:RagB/SusD family nutrient uptake outer membrane protein [Chitinophagales bacterium]
MKFLTIKKIITATSVAVVIITGNYSCNIDKLTDPNNPSVEAIELAATVEEMNNLVTGSLSSMRIDLSTYVDACGMIGREYYYFSGADPRFTADLLGKEASQLDNNTFYLLRPWAARYRTVRNCWILRHSIENTIISETELSVEEKNGYLGFAKTIQAYEILLNLNMTFDNGVRLDVEDPDALGSIVGYLGGLDGISALLDDAYTNLQNAGGTFRFTLSGGFAGFDTPADFAKFNRGIKARVAVYHEDWAGAEDALNNSFLDLAGALGTGVYHVYSTGPGDQLNDIYLAANLEPGGLARCAHNSFVTEAEAGDLRLSKAPARDETAVQDGLSSDYDVFIYPDDLTPVCLIRNEELILIYAEVKAQTGAAGDAESAINTIRTIAGGLPEYSGGTSTDELINEILKQRRYSLFAEAHRWIDMRRYGKLDELPIDRPADDVWQEFPLPADEASF